MDRRHKRKEKTREKILAALERLQRGEGTHPRHIGIAVRLTKQAVAREAGVAPATLYNFPDLVAKTAEVMELVTRPKPAAMQRRNRFVEEITRLTKERDQLLAENLRLMRLLVKHEPSIAKPSTVDLAAERSARRGPSKVPD